MKRQVGKFERTGQRSCSGRGQQWMPRHWRRALLRQLHGVRHAEQVSELSTQQGRLLREVKIFGTSPFAMHGWDRGQRRFLFYRISRHVITHECGHVDAYIMV